MVNRDLLSRAGRLFVSEHLHIAAARTDNPRETAGLYDYDTVEEFHLHESPTVRLSNDSAGVTVVVRMDVPDSLLPLLIERVMRADNEALTAATLEELKVLQNAKGLAELADAAENVSIDSKAVLGETHPELLDDTPVPEKPTDWQHPDFDLEPGTVFKLIRDLGDGWPEPGTRLVFLGEHTFAPLPGEMSLEEYDQRGNTEPGTERMILVRRETDWLDPEALCDPEWDAEVYWFDVDDLDLVVAPSDPPKAGDRVVVIADGKDHPFKAGEIVVLEDDPGVEGWPIPATLWGDVDARRGNLLPCEYQKQPTPLRPAPLAHRPYAGAVVELTRDHGPLKAGLRTVTGRPPKSRTAAAGHLWYDRGNPHLWFIGTTPKGLSYGDWIRAADVQMITMPPSSQKMTVHEKST